MVVWTNLDFQGARNPDFEGKWKPREKEALCPSGGSVEEALCKRHDFGLVKY